MDTIGVSFLDPLEDYEIIQRIGSGTYGDVFKVRDAPDRTTSQEYCNLLKHGNLRSP